MKKLKKSLSLLLALVMAMSCMSMSAFAENGNVAKIGTTEYATLAEALEAIRTKEMAGDVTIELLANTDHSFGARTKYGTNETTSITIDGGNHTLNLRGTDTDWSSIGMTNAEGTFSIKNATVTKTEAGNGAWNNHALNFKSGNFKMENVVFQNEIAFESDSNVELRNVTVTEVGEYYAIWLTAAVKNATIDSCTITATTNNGRGIKIADEYVDENERGQVNLRVSNSTFNTAKKAAVLVTNTAGANITWGTDNNISGVLADSKNAVWIDEDRATNADKVTVTGANCVVEGRQAKIENAYYPTLADAIAAAQNGDTVTLLNNVALDGSVAIKDKDIVLDLNGQKLNTSLAVYSGLTVKDSGTDGELVASTKDWGIWANTGSHVTIESGTVKAKSWAIVVQGLGTVLDVNGGKIVMTGNVRDDAAISGIGNNGDKGYTININGGEIVSNGLGIYHPNVDTLNIKGGTITGQTAVYQKSGKLNITGGKLVATGTKTPYQYNNNGGYPTGDALVIDNCGYPGGVPTATISGGTFNSENGDAVGSYVKQDDPAQTGSSFERVGGFITGGTFSSALDSSYIADGFEQNTSGAVVAKSTFAGKDDTAVETELNAAITANPSTTAIVITPAAGADANKTYVAYMGNNEEIVKTALTVTTATVADTTTNTIASGAATTNTATSAATAIQTALAEKASENKADSTKFDVAKVAQQLNLSGDQEVTFQMKTEVKSVNEDATSVVIDFTPYANGTDVSSYLNDTIDLEVPILPSLKNKPVTIVWSGATTDAPRYFTASDTSDGYVTIKVNHFSSATQSETQEENILGCAGYLKTTNADIRASLMWNLYFVIDNFNNLVNPKIVVTSAYDDEINNKEYSLTAATDEGHEGLYMVTVPIRHRLIDQQVGLTLKDNNGTYSLKLGKNGTTEYVSVPYSFNDYLTIIEGGKDSGVVSAIRAYRDALLLRWPLN